MKGCVEATSLQLTCFLSLTCLPSSTHRLYNTTTNRALEFLITTGPGPVPRLDGLNPVFGRVESGMDVVARLAQVGLLCRLAVACRGVIL